jgi:ribonuclease H-related protein
MTKFYAVRKGKQPGIFNTWEQCKKSVEGFKNAEYKSFTSMDEAQLYLSVSNNNIISEEIKNEMDIETKTIRAYIDGSYSKQLGKYAYGCVLIDGNVITRLSGSGTSDIDSNLWNVTGELNGAVKAIEWSIENNFKRLIIFYDYEGIAKWASGEWKAKKEGTKQYIEALHKYKKLIDIEFIKVKAHSGDKFNEEADRLAKEALNSKQNHEEPIPKNRLQDESLILFRDVMKLEDQGKNSVNFSFKEYKMTDGKLKKFAKDYWKTTGNKINEIESFDINVDFNNGLLIWKYKQKNGETYNFEMLIN